MANYIFDLDGTIIDPEIGIIGCLRKTLSDVGMIYPEECDAALWIGPPMRQSLKTLLQTDNSELIEKALAIYRSYYGNEGVLGCSVYDGIAEAIKTLRQDGHQLFVGTSKLETFAVDIIEKIGLKEYFVGVYGTVQGKHYDDKTELIARIIEQTNISASETIMVGDRKYDMIAAVNNNIHSIGVLWGYGTRPELEASGAKCIIEKPSELMQELK